MKVHKTYLREETGEPFEYSFCGHDLRGGLGRSSSYFSPKKFSVDWDKVDCKACLKYKPKTEDD